MTDLTVILDLNECFDNESAQDFINNAIKSALKDYFFTEDFRKSVFSEVIKDFILTTFKSEISVKCREIIQKMGFSDVFGWNCSNPVTSKVVVDCLVEEKDKMKTKLLEMLDRSAESTVEQALVSYINKELQTYTCLKVQVERK